VDAPAEKQRKSPRKQQQRSLVTQQKLLDAAIAAFSENGFKGTSTRDIAERAGVHHPLITYHFKNKDQLWRAAATRIYGELQAALEDALTAPDKTDIKTRMATRIRTYLRHSYYQPAVHNMIVQESSHPNPRLDWLIETYMRPMFEEALEELAELQQNGVAPPGNTALLFSMIRVSSGSLVSRNLVARNANDVDFDSQKMLDELGDMIVRVFLPG
jgi:AcrR family transcriptional regulator